MPEPTDKVFLAALCAAFSVLACLMVWLGVLEERVALWAVKAMAFVSVLVLVWSLAALRGMRSFVASASLLVALALAVATMLLFAVGAAIA